MCSLGLLQVNTSPWKKAHRTPSWLSPLSLCLLFDIISLNVCFSLSLSFPYSILEETLFGPSSWYKQSPSYGRILYCFYIQCIFPSIVFFCIYFHILCHAQTTRVKYSFSERRCVKLYIYERKTKRMVLRGKPPWQETSSASSPGPQKPESVAVFEAVTDQSQKL